MKILHRILDTWKLCPHNSIFLRQSWTKYFEQTSILKKSLFSSLPLSDNVENVDKICSNIFCPRLYYQVTIFQRRIYHIYLFLCLKMSALSIQCQRKVAFAACNFCQNTSFRQIETKPILFLCAITHIL